MRYILLLLLIVPFFSNGQIIGENQLWKGYGIKDTADNPLGNKMQQFITHDSKQLLLCNIQERPNKETQEIELNITVDTFQIERTKSGYNAVSPKVTLRLEVISEDDLRLYFKGYYFFFKLEPKVKSNVADIASLDKSLIDFKFKTTAPGKEESIDGITKKVNVEIIEYQFGESGEVIERPYKIFDFSGYVFLKAVSYPALMLDNIVENKVSFYEMTYDSLPNFVTWQKIEE